MNIKNGVTLIKRVVNDLVGSVKNEELTYETTMTKIAELQGLTIE
ncbi:hypothetical protein ACQKOF_05565 [Lysinibacillus sp. NPDC093190]